MTAVSRRLQKSKRDKNHRPFSGNVKERYLKEKRLESKGGNNFRHSGCPGCEYCTNRKREAISRKILDRELADYQLIYC